MKRHAALVLLVLASGACDVILGVHDIPDAEAPADGNVGVDGPLPDVQSGPDGKSDAGIVDAPIDVPPDTPPLPTCGTGNECTALAPSGWTGPVAFAVASGNSVSGCSGVYSTVGPAGHDGPSAGNASCTCTCPSTASTTCPDPVLDIWSGNSCNTLASSPTLTPSMCSSDFSSGSVDVKEGSPTVGSCTPSSSTSVPSINWSHSYATCGYADAPDASGCSAGSVCVASPGGSFASKPCVYQSGDVACPAGAYSQKNLLYTGDSDNRGCTTCSCPVSGGSCSVSYTAYTGSSCGSGSIGTFAGNGTCQGEAASVVSVMPGAVSTTAATCSPSGGSPTGSVSVSGPVTVCCQL